MKSLASPKFAARVSAVLAIMATLVATVACGSSGGLIHPLPGGFSNASLNGQYVIAQTGIAVNQTGTAADPFSEVIVFTADGNGNLTVGVDDFDQSGTTFEDKNLSGAYSVSRDGTGTLKVNFTNGSSNYGLALFDDSHFYIIETDFAATASGYGEKQTATALPSGKFVFKAHQLDTSSRVGGISITNGAISGTEDLLNLGSSSTSNAVSTTVAMTAPDMNGSGTFTLSDGSSFFYYVVSAGKFRFLSNVGTLEIGQAEAQSGAFSLATLASGNSYVFGSAGDTNVSGAAGIHSAGVFTSDGSGNITGGAVDSVEDATVNSDLSVSGGTYTLDSSGRGQINLTLSGGVINPQVFWMADATHAYFLVDSTTAIEDGTFTLQQPPPLNPVAMQAAFVMDGFDAAFKDRAGALQPTTGGNFNWNQRANAFDPNPNSLSFGGNPTVLATTGTYTAGSNGRVTVTVNGITNATNGWVFYFSSASSGVMVEEDGNGLGGVNNVGGVFSEQAAQ